MSRTAILILSQTSLTPTSLPHPQMSRGVNYQVLYNIIGPPTFYFPKDTHRSTCRLLPVRLRRTQHHILSVCASDILIYVGMTSTV